MILAYLGVRSSPSPTDEELWQALDQRKNWAWEYLWEANKDSIAGYIFKQGGNKEDIKEVRQNAALAFLEGVSAGKINRDTVQNLHGYFRGTCRFIWLNSQRNGFHITDIDDVDPIYLPDDLDALSHMIMDETKRCLYRCLDMLEANCQKIWKSALEERKKTPELVAELGYKNDQSYRQAKSSCKKKLFALVRQNCKH